MPSVPVCTTPEYRQFTRLHYTSTSERDAGVSHLRHVERLAEIELNGNRGCTDNPEVNFANPPTMDAIHLQETGTTPQERYDRAVRQQEQEIVKENSLTMKRLLNNESQSFRQARHMNHFPTPEELARFYKVEDQLYFKAKVREQTFKNISEGNRILLRHLYETKPSTKSAAEMSQWFHNVHKKRLEQLSRFRPTENFSGENVLRHHGVKMPLGQRGSRGAPLLECEDTRKAGTMPLRSRHPFPQPSYQAYSRATAVRGKPTYPTPEDERAALKGPRPAWQPVSVADVPLLNFISDSALHYPRRPVTVPEENACTRFWRRGMRGIHPGEEDPSAAPQPLTYPVTGPKKSAAHRTTPQAVSSSPPNDAVEREAVGGPNTSTAPGSRAGTGKGASRIRPQSSAKHPSYEAFARAASRHRKPVYPTVEDELAVRRRTGEPQPEWKDLNSNDVALLNFITDTTMCHPRRSCEKGSSPHQMSDMTHDYRKVDAMDWKSIPPPWRFQSYLAPPEPSYEAFAHAAVVQEKLVYPSPEDEAAVHRRGPRPEWKDINKNDVKLLNFITDTSLVRPMELPKEEIWLREMQRQQEREDKLAANRAVTTKPSKPSKPSVPVELPPPSAGAPKPLPQPVMESGVGLPSPSSLYGEEEGPQPPMNAKDLPLFPITSSRDSFVPTTTRSHIHGSERQDSSLHQTPVRPPAPPSQGSTPVRGGTHNPFAPPPRTSPPESGFTPHRPTFPPPPPPTEALLQSGRGGVGVVPLLPLMDGSTPDRPHGGLLPAAERDGDPKPVAAAPGTPPLSEADREEVVTSSSNSAINIPVASASEPSRGHGHTDTVQGSAIPSLHHVPVATPLGAPEATTTRTPAESAGTGSALPSHRVAVQIPDRAPKTAEDLLMDALLEEWRQAATRKDAAFLPI